MGVEHGQGDAAIARSGAPEDKREECVYPVERTRTPEAFSVLRRRKVERPRGARVDVSVGWVSWRSSIEHSVEEQRLSIPAVILRLLLHPGTFVSS